MSDGTDAAAAKLVVAFMDIDSYSPMHPGYYPADREEARIHAAAWRLIGRDQARDFNAGMPADQWSRYVERQSAEYPWEFIGRRHNGSWYIGFFNRAVELRHAWVKRFGYFDYDIGENGAYTPHEFSVRLSRHQTWLADPSDPGGSQASFDGDDLRILNRRISDSVSLSGASFRDSNLSGMDFTPGRDLSHCDFSGANLQGINLQGVNLSGANLSGALLDGANLVGTNLDGTTLTDMSINAVRCDAATIIALAAGLAS
jgi:hypothetical protein